MIFTSYTYLLFLTIVFVVHWSLVPAARKYLLIGASYVFYCSWHDDKGSWHWEFGFLLLGVTLFNWWYARFILARERGPLWVGVAVNVAVLGVFKYLAWMVDNINAALHITGVGIHMPHLDILLPLGISFFTFQGVAYLVDVATGEEPLRSLRDFMLFKAFWPQLIAGPIVRLDEMREQLAVPRKLAYENVAQGSQRILFGWVKKVLADNIGQNIDPVFMAGKDPHAIDSVAAMIGFGMRIYLDFSAYSDIAIGSALLFGYRFPENFNWPYVARSPREFWNRWHMSLSRWIRDYVFMPLSFANRDRPYLGPLWLLIAMTLCGLWHGAAWTMIAWGAWHGVLLVLNQGPLKKVFPPSEEESKTVPWMRRIAGVALTWGAVNVGWVLFRAPSLHVAGTIFRSMVTLHGRFHPSIMRENAVLFVGVTFMALSAIAFFRRYIEAFLRVPETLVAEALAAPDWGLRVARALSVARPVAYAMLLILVIVFDPESQSFVYFQF